MFAFWHGLSFPQSHCRRVLVLVLASKPLTLPDVPRPAFMFRGKFEPAGETVASRRLIIQFMSSFFWISASSVRTVRRCRPPMWLARRFLARLPPLLFSSGRLFDPTVRFSIRRATVIVAGYLFGFPGTANFAPASSSSALFFQLGVRHRRPVYLHCPSGRVPLGPAPFSPRHSGRSSKVRRGPGDLSQTGAGF